MWFTLPLDIMWMFSCWCGGKFLIQFRNAGNANSFVTIKTWFESGVNNVDSWNQCWINGRFVAFPRGTNAFGTLHNCFNSNGVSGCIKSRWSRDPNPLIPHGTWIWIFWYSLRRNFTCGQEQDFHFVMERVWPLPLSFFQFFHRPYFSFQ